MPLSQEIYEALPPAWILLTDDFPYDTDKLVELHRNGFYGMALKRAKQIEKLDPRHLMCLIDVRSLAPFVHSMIATDPRPLDRGFLQLLVKAIDHGRPQNHDIAHLALGVEGDALSKPLEHLVTCVPGVEVRRFNHMIAMGNC